MPTTFKNLMFLEKYNNYFNRIIKQGYLLTSEYAIYQTDNNLRYSFLSAVNFNPNDGCNTEHIVNWTEDFIPDYMVVGDNEQTSSVISRWFVTEFVRLRGQQFRATLKRDVIADNYQAVVSAPCFIEKATLQNDNPLIFNDEGMTFNQIKTKETLLTDKTKSAWIIGYVDRKQTKPLTINVTPKCDFDYTGTTYPIPNVLSTKKFNAIISDVKIHNYCLSSGTTAGSVAAKEIINAYDPKFENGRVDAIQTFIPSGLEQISLDVTSFSETAQELIESTTDMADDIISAIQSTYSASADVEKFLQTINKIVFYQNKYYRIRLDEVTYTNKLSAYFDSSTSLGTALQYVNSHLSTAEARSPGKFRIEFTKREYNIQLIEINVNLGCPISSTRRKLNDAPYDMFAIPYGKVKLKNGSLSVTSNLEDTKNIAQAITEQLGTNIFDVQLLPYCPLQSLISGDGELTLSATEVEHTDYDYITTVNETTGTVTNVGFILWANESNFTLDIDFKVFVEEPKVQNLTDMYRLCSPNYQGVFEFSPAKNGGVRYINVDCTYKPYNPYIHLNPSFGLLYGRDFNDSRGLVCGGDFSVAQLSNAWTQYEINNKNYQNIFDRSVVNMEVQRGFQRVNEIGNAITGTAQGAIMGGMMGGVGGAIAGGVTSGVAGIADVAMSEASYKENLSYKTDLFNYQLGNIKAMPNSITKISALTYNNKLFPFIEYYTCTQEEKTALRNKLKYNGMTVGIIGSIGDYLQGEPTFIQGQIIRLDSISDDTHTLNIIYEEIKKGVYI